MMAVNRSYLYVWISWAILLLWAQGAALADDAPVCRPLIMKLGYPHYAFNDVDLKDAQVAMEIWTKHLVKGSVPVDSKVTIYKDEESLLRALQTNEANMAALASTTYLKVKDKLPLAPFFVPLSKGQVGEEFCLLVHRQSGITAASQLKNRKLLYFPRCSAGSPQNLWLNNFLRNEGLADKDRLFQSLTVTETPSQAILPVFFRKTDACYVPRQVFETMAEMNPQVGRNLQILAHSPPIVRGLLVIRSDIDPNLKELLTKSLNEMDKQPQGRQILTLLRYDRLIPYQPGHLANIVDCLKKMTILEAHHQKKK
jgi:ABC-type phosphate/phosphonate transport system substrate-binding protein